MPTVHHSTDHYACELAATIGVYPDHDGRERLKTIITKISRQGADQALDGPWSAILHAEMSDEVRATLLAAVTQASAQFGNARLKR